MKPLKIWHVVRLTNLQTLHLGVSQDVKAFGKVAMLRCSALPTDLSKRASESGVFSGDQSGKLVINAVL
jgi:hypothetical protein